jgi:hypothetical protein
MSKREKSRAFCMPVGWDEHRDAADALKAVINAFVRLPQQFRPVE